jgi:hypothetical protein
LFLLNIAIYFISLLIISVQAFSQAFGSVYLLGNFLQNQGNFKGKIIC